MSLLVSLSPSLQGVTRNDGEAVAVGKSAVVEREGTTVMGAKSSPPPVYFSSLSCHSEHSEESFRQCKDKILRCAQNDSNGVQSDYNRAYCHLIYRIRLMC